MKLKRNWKNLLPNYINVFCKNSHLPNELRSMPKQFQFLITFAFSTTIFYGIRTTCRNARFEVFSQRYNLNSPERCFAKVKRTFLASIAILYCRLKLACYFCLVRRGLSLARSKIKSNYKVNFAQKVILKQKMQLIGNIFAICPAI